MMNINASLASKLAFYFLALFLISCSKQADVINMGHILEYKPLPTSSMPSKKPKDIIASACYKEIFWIKSKKNKPLNMISLLQEAAKSQNKTSLENVFIWQESFRLGHIYTRVCLNLSPL